MPHRRPRHVTGEPGEWYSDMHTADDIAAARSILMKWADHTGNADAAARMAQRTTERAITLGLETA
jgi:hypothetical protein